MKRNVLLIPHLCLFFAKRFPAGRWSFLGPGSETKWYSTNKERPGGKWDRVAELMMIKFGERGHPVFPSHRVHCLEERSKAKEVDNYLYTSVPMVIRLKLFFEQLFLSISSVSTEQSQICVRKYGSCQTSTGRPVLAEQSDPLLAPANLLIMTPRPLIEIFAQEILLQKYKERVERLPQRDRLIKNCTYAGFLKTVEVGQYFMTKHTDEFSQLTEPVPCREYTLPRDEKSTDPKGGIQGNTNIGPVMGSHNQLFTR